MGQKIRITVEDELKSFLPRYLENRKRDLAILEDALRTGDFQLISNLSHKIKGHALSYGFGPLTQTCACIERAASEKKRDVIAALLYEYRSYIENVELNLT